MAKQRDVRAQRKLLSSATWQVMAEDGLPGLTLRAVADRAGCTTGLLMHTFPTKQALLLHARDLLYERTAARLDAAEDFAHDPATALRNVVAQVTDTAEDRQDEARIWVGFLAAAFADDELANRHRAANRSFIGRIERLVTACRPEWTRGKVESKAKALVALIEGFNILAAADPSAFSLRIRRTALTEALDRITTLD